MPASQPVSFLPKDFMERRKQRRLNVIGVTLFTIVAAGVGSAYTYAQRDLKNLNARHVAVEEEFTRAAHRIAQVEQLQKSQAHMSRQAELSASLLERVPRSFLLAKVTNALPHGVSLLELELESRKIIIAAKPQTALDKRRAAKEPATPELPQPARYDVTVLLTGIAGTDVQVADFLGRLKEIEIFSAVELQITDAFKQEETELRRFKAELKLDPEAQPQLLLTSTEEGAH